MKARSIHGRRTARKSRSKQGRFLLASSLSLAGVLGATSAFAQQPIAPAPAASAPAKGESEEAKAAAVTTVQSVTVTARKTQEKLVDIPLSVQAISSKELADAGPKNLSDIANLAAGVTVNSSGAENATNIVIRGVANLNAGSGDPNVAVFLDGVYLANPSAISLGLIDMERVEIIKGPVSALYGRNAFGGVINYVSKKPFNELEAGATATIGNDGGQTETVTVSGPLIKNMLTARLTVGHDKSDGTWKDDVTGRRAGGFEKKDAQGSFDFTPTKALDVTGAAYYGYDKFQDPAMAYLDNNCGVGGVGEYCGKVTDDEHGVEIPSLNPGSGATGNQRRVISSNLKVSYDFGPVDASALFGYNKVTQRRYSDFSAQRAGLPFETTTDGGATTEITDLHELFGDDANNQDKSVELRIASKQDQPFRWATGMYLYRATSLATTIIGIDGSGLAPGQTLFGPLASIQDLFLTSNGQYSTSNFTAVTQSDHVNSPFASAEYDFNTMLTGALEVRRTIERKSQQIERNSFIANTVDPYGGSTSAVFGFNNYRGSLRFKPTDDSMYYVSIANGTKAGGFNQRATIPSEISFAPETNVTTEAGTKLSFLEKRLQVGVSVFHVQTKGMQVSGPSDDPTNTGFVTKNFGGTTSDGFDLDIAAVPVRGLTVNAGVGYADSKFKSGSYDFTNPAQCAAIPSCAARVVTVSLPGGSKQAIDLTNYNVPFAPRLTTSLGVQYDGRINDDWAYFGRVDYHFETKKYTAPDNFNYYGPRNTVDLNGGVSTDRYSIKLFVDNVTNDKTPQTALPQTQLNNFQAYMVAYMPIKRTYGVTLGIQY